MPRGACEEDKQRQQFEATEEHQKGRGQLGMHTVTGIVFNRADGTQPGTNVADATQSYGDSVGVVDASYNHDGSSEENHHHG